jgi:hypothetical protein
MVTKINLAFKSLFTKRNDINNKSNNSALTKNTETADVQKR